MTKSTWTTRHDVYFKKKEKWFKMGLHKAVHWSARPKPGQIG